ncbi:unnamed protein product [Acanthosepion pharaonis]|uniref:Uncharacterized protein n=1 Tax=Acanthosepion pharaonis TaxID=158019 RepID=A0A812EVZ2_ACAPH|nr:unnamed protein product [Sepia pharaonis]
MIYFFRVALTFFLSFPFFLSFFQVTCLFSVSLQFVSDGAYQVSLDHETTDLISRRKMLAEYPYGMIRATAVLHALFGGAIIGVNIHAIRKATDIFDIPLLGTPDLISQGITYLFIPMFVAGIYICIVGMTGEAASSRSKNPSTVNNFKIFYLVLNILSAFFYSLFCGVSTFGVYMVFAHSVDVFGIATHLKATLGLLAAELLLSLFCTLLCCLSRHPAENLPTPTVVPNPIPTVAAIQMPQQVYNPPNSMHPYPIS